MRVEGCLNPWLYEGKQVFFSLPLKKVAYIYGGRRKQTLTPQPSTPLFKLKKPNRFKRIF